MWGAWMVVMHVRLAWRRRFLFRADALCPPLLYRNDNFFLAFSLKPSAFSFFGFQLKFPILASTSHSLFY